MTEMEKFTRAVPYAEELVTWKNEHQMNIMVMKLAGFSKEEAKRWAWGRCLELSMISQYSFIEVLIDEAYAITKKRWWRRT